MNAPHLLGAARLCGVLCLIILTLSCNDRPVSPATSGENDVWTLGAKEYASGAAGLHRILFDSVLTDSRCPLRALCVWEGEASVRFILLPVPRDTLRLMLKIRGYTMRADTARHLPLDTLGYRFTLLQLDPYPSIGVTIRPGDYAATIRITHK